MSAATDYLAKTLREAASGWHAAESVREVLSEVARLTFDLREVVRERDQFHSDRDAARAELATVTENQQRQWTEKDHYRTRAIDAETKLIAARAALRDVAVRVSSDAMQRFIALARPDEPYGAADWSRGEYCIRAALAATPLVTEEDS